MIRRPSCEGFGSAGETNPTVPVRSGGNPARLPRVTTAARMPALMRDRLVCCVLVALGAIVGAAGCGKEIGDPCTIAADCSPNGDRICIDSTGANEDGYCTVQGCDITTCPSEAACVQFFTGSFDNKVCDPDPYHPESPD